MQGGEVTIDVLPLETVTGEAATATATTPSHSPMSSRPTSPGPSEVSGADPAGLQSPACDSSSVLKSPGSASTPIAPPSAASATPGAAQQQQQQRQPYAIDSFGFYVQSDAQPIAPAEIPQEEIAACREEAQWWMSAVRNHRSVKTASTSYRDMMSRRLYNNNNRSNGGGGGGDGDGMRAGSPGSDNPGRSSSGGNGGGGGDSDEDVFSCSNSSSKPALEFNIVRNVRLRVRHGFLNPSVRKIVWPYLAGSLDAPRDKYEPLITKDAIPFEIAEVILRDLPRTFPTHCLFVTHESFGQSSLHRILNAYCNLDPEVGYCQGMGFLVAVLLLHLPEEGAFWTFAQLMQGQKYQMRKLFLPGFPLLQHFFVLLRRLLKELLPKLAFHLEDQGVDVSFFASQWFLTLFSYQVPIPVACRLWDLFFSEGWLFIFRVTIGLLQNASTSLCDLKMENVLMQLKTIHEGLTAEDIVRMALDVPLTEEDMRIDVEGI